MNVSFLEHSRSASCYSYDSPVITKVPLVLGELVSILFLSMICYQVEIKQNWLYFLNNRMWSSNEIGGVSGYEGRAGWHIVLRV